MHNNHILFIFAMLEQQKQTDEETYIYTDTFAPYD